MVIRGFLVAVLLFVSGLLAGCGDGTASPFEGDWVSATAGRLSFEDDKWTDADGDSGKFDFSGKYPTFTVVFRSDAGNFERLATFADKHTFELCDIGPGGTLLNCNDFVYGPYTIPNV